MELAFNEQPNELIDDMGYSSDFGPEYFRRKFQREYDKKRYLSIWNRFSNGNINLFNRDSSYGSLTRCFLADEIIMTLNCLVGVLLLYFALRMIFTKDPK